MKFLKKNGNVLLLDNELIPLVEKIQSFFTTFPDNLDQDTVKDSEDLIWDLTIAEHECLHDLLKLIHLTYFNPNQSAPQDRPLWNLCTKLSVLFQESMDLFVLFYRISDQFGIDSLRKAMLFMSVVPFLYTSGAEEIARKFGITSEIYSKPVVNPYFLHTEDK